MGLSELQAALARLCTDPAALARWQENPEAFASEARLSPAERRTLAETEAVSGFARSLVAKRAREAGHYFPLTRRALGPGYRELFARFAGEVPVSRDPARDAAAFLKWLPAKPQPVRYERARLAGHRYGAGVYRLGGRWFVALWWRGRCRRWPRSVPEH